MSALFEALNLNKNTLAGVSFAVTGVPAPSVKCSSRLQPYLLQ